MNDDTGMKHGRARVLLADPKPLESQLLCAALERQGFIVQSCACELPAVLELAGLANPDVAVLGCAGAQSGLPDLSVLRGLHVAYPQLPKILLLDTADREVVLHAFRCGARGLFSLAESSFQSLCACIEKVQLGEVAATSEQLTYLLDAVCQPPSLRVMTVNGDKVLTSREEQVVALVADGLSNRSVAAELGLSEHTVKKYLFRIFEKLGISNRVELVLYAVHNGTPMAAQWIGG